MEEWKEYKLGEVCKEIFAGGDASKFVQSKEQTIEYPYPIYSNGTEDKALYGYTNTAVVSTPAITISARGTIGFVALRKTPFVPIVRLLTLIPCDNVNTEYLYYCLKNGSVDGTGSATQQLTVPMIKDKVVSLPSLKTQRRIAAVLSSLDAKIEVNRRINDNLEQQAGALFRSWFVDFEPFGGVMPEEWEMGRLKDIATISSGKRPPMKQEYKDDIANIPLIGAASIMGFTNQSNCCEKILVTGRVGTHGVIQRYSSPCWASDNTLVIKSKYYEYVYQLLKRIDYSSLNRGSTQPLITQSDMNNVQVIRPSERTLAKFEQTANALMLRCEANVVESARLSQLRDTLLPKLMSGELKVDEIEIKE